jgi:uncharacterized membrane protein YbhN (UPF0104 family)
MVTTRLARPAEVTANQERSPTRRSSWRFTLLKVVVSVLAIGVVLRTVDLGDAWQRMANQDLRLLLAAVGILVVQICVGGLRWNTILRRLGAPVAVVDTLRFYYISLFFSACFWGAVSGDIVRVWLSFRAKMSTRTATMSVILDRVAALAAVALLVLGTAPWFFARAGATGAAAVPAALAVAGLLGIALAAQFDRLPVAWQQWQPMRLLQLLGEATRTIFLRPAAALPTLALALAAQTLMAVSAYVVAASLTIEVSLLDCIVLMQPVAMITALPISIGGWGVRETAMIALFGLADVPSSAALALSIQLGLLAMVVSLPGALLWLTLKDRAREAPSANLIES